jgi:hypothetical protein
MLSLIGLPDGFAGSGEGSGTAGSIDEVREDLAEAAEAPKASANPFSDKPAANAMAVVFLAIFLKCLDIIPSSGMAAELPPDAA